MEIGCGKYKIYKNSIGLDKYSLEGVDVIWDLESQKPLPFDDETFDLIIANHVLEHITNFFPLMEELHRILKPNRIIKIRVPCWQSKDAFKSDHKRFFCLDAFDYFESSCEENYLTKVRFEVLKKRLRFVNVRSRWQFLNCLISPIINSWQGFFEKFLILPAEEIYFELKKKKG